MTARERRQKWAAATSTHTITIARQPIGRYNGPTLIAMSGDLTPICTYNHANKRIHITFRDGTHINIITITPEAIEACLPILPPSPEP